LWDKKTQPRAFFFDDKSGKKHINLVECKEEEALYLLMDENKD
jgi:hypothetical protein